jgi:tRNA-specific 2-thiouridylase
MKIIKKKLKIAVAMSGGVDSSVAAKLLVDQGYEVIGIFLHFWHEENPPSPPATSAGQALYQGGSFENKCCSTEALLDARRVANKIGIPLYTLNFAKIFKEQVVDNFLSEYAKGRTPNPCIRCNKLVKLGYLIKQAKKLGFDFVASGHYVRNYELRITNYEFKYKLLKAKDKDKDQSYFLYTLNQSELKHLLFPLGDYTKSQVRRLAKKFKLPVAAKKDSQEICFIPEKSHNEFLKRHLKLRSGDIRITPLIKGGVGIIGRHQGLPLYTIGQRKGIAIGGTGPFYVAKMDYQTNTLYVADNGNDKILYNNKLIAKNVNWLAGIEPKLPFFSDAVIRYRHKPVQGVISKISKNKYQVKFDQSPRAITSGQSVVFYKNNEVLGGGIICQNSAYFIY